MANTVVSIGLAFLITLLFMFALLPVARSVGLIDRPGGRKTHIGEIPVTGGLAMFGGLLISSPFIFQSLTGFPFFLAALTILVLVGALDDRFDLPPLVRALAQTCAALIMVLGAGLTVSSLGNAFFGGVVNLDWSSSLFTVLIVMAATNAFNMFDGSDGVAGIQATVALLAVGFACFMGGQLQALPVVGCLFGCVMAFLIFNWPSARTREVRAFMGDAGSTMLGFSLAWLGVAFSQGESRVISPAAVLWVFALPLYDFFSSMVRRISEGRSPFHGDSDHLHHLLRRSGLSPRRVALAILIGGSVVASVGIAGYLAGLPDGVLVLAWLAVGVIYHVIFGSGLVVRRRATERVDVSTPAANDSGVYATLRRQRR
jgi:UDP-GlcNAc:undecaprenyl-phosphate/decaprenyl-phosphate GlcNAc-1-phosphate transferase